MIHDSIPTLQTKECSWLDLAWLQQSERSRQILTHRIAGKTLEMVAQDLGVVRERVRQLQKKSTDELLAAQQVHDPELPVRLKVGVGARSAISEEELAELTHLRADVARDVILGQLGLAHPAVWTTTIPDLWAFDRSALGGQLADLVSMAPFTDGEARIAAANLGIPGQLDLAGILSYSGSKLSLHDLGWIRKARQGRDIAYLWLRADAEPRTTAEIAAVTENTEHAIRETMRRDELFAQVRPEGTWALADWRSPGADNRYSSAVEVMVGVLHDFGPLDLERLRAETQQRYPVSVWRINQCLSSNLIGLNDDGLYDLVERGATPIEDSEPKQPAHIQASGSVVGVELLVDRDVLRGSGIPVSRWLTWHLGLRTAPSSRYFRLPGSFGEVTIRRATSNAQISSLRAVAKVLGAVKGCKITLLLHTDTAAADVRHTCAPGTCPAQLPTLARLP